MDPLTHTLAGAAVGEAFFRRSLGRSAVWICAGAANLPDLDAVIMLSGDPGGIFLRRSFGHSVLLLPLWIGVFAWAVRRKHGELPLSSLLSAAVLNVVLHLYLDLVNSFGVQLLWPLTTYRWEIGTTFVIDFALTALLACAFFPRMARARSARLALCAAAVYLLACLALRREADRLLQAAAPDSPARHVFPEPLGAHRWKGVARTPAGWDVYTLRPLRGESELKAAVRSEDSHPAVQAAKRLPAARRLEHFLLAPVWRAGRAADGDIVTAHDLRYRSFTLPRGNVFDFVFFLPD